MTTSFGKLAQGTRVNIFKKIRKHRREPKIPHDELNGVMRSWMTRERAVLMNSNNVCMKRDRYIDKSLVQKETIMILRSYGRRQGNPLSK